MKLLFAQTQGLDLPGHDRLTPTCIVIPNVLTRLDEIASGIGTCIFRPNSIERFQQPQRAPKMMKNRAAAATARDFCDTRHYLALLATPKVVELNENELEIVKTAVDNRRSKY